MKIKSTNVHAFGKTLNVPIDGKVTLSDEGVAEVSNEAGELLIANSPNWELAEAEKKETKKAVKKAEIVEETPKKEENVETTGEEVKEPEITQESLNTLEFEDLVEQAKELGISQEEIDICKGKKVLLIAKIMKALK